MRFALDLRESLGIAFDAIRANKRRGMLTTLGIIIGIVAVITTMTAANGLQNTFREGFSSVGSDVLYVSRMPWVVMDDFFQYKDPSVGRRFARVLADPMKTLFFQKAEKGEVDAELNKSLYNMFTEDK